MSMNNCQLTLTMSLQQAHLRLLPGHRVQHVHDATKRHHTDLGLAVIDPKGQQQPVPPRVKVLDPGDELRALAVGCVLGGASIQNSPVVAVIRWGARSCSV